MLFYGAFFTSMPNISAYANRDGFSNNLCFFDKRQMFVVLSYCLLIVFQYKL